MAWWGTLIGGALGYVFAGPLGALVGARPAGKAVFVRHGGSLARFGTVGPDLVDRIAVDRDEFDPLLGEQLFRFFSPADAVQPGEDGVPAAGEEAGEPDRLDLAHAETKKIIDPSVKVTATCVRVPVFVGHSESVNVEFEDFLDEDEARDILRESPGIMVVDKRENGGYVTPKECVGDFATFISRIRQDSMTATFKGLGYSVLLASPAPLIFLTFGAALATSQYASVFASAVGDALLHTGRWLAFLTILLVLFMSKGVTERHFGWSGKTLASACYFCGKAVMTDAATDAESDADGGHQPAQPAEVEVNGTQRRQDADDRDHNHQFDKGKTLLCFLLDGHLSPLDYSFLVCRHR